MGLRKTYVNHRPTEAKARELEAFREAADTFHTALEHLCPVPSREKSLALTKLEECVMWAVKGAVLNDPNSAPCQPVAGANRIPTHGAHDKCSKQLRCTMVAGHDGDCAG